MRCASLVALFALLALSLVGGTSAGERSLASAAAERALVVDLGERVEARRRETWRWQRLMRRRRTPAGRRSIDSVAYGRWVLRLWTARALRARRQALHPPHERAWICIHRHEGSWSDPGAPYYGGLQMDLSFQAAYGRDLLRRKGTADHWSAIEQMWVAERAFRTRGFWPWPSTARSCGLL